jgi:hypothetical protein
MSVKQAASNAARYYIPEDRILHSYSWEELKSENIHDIKRRCVKYNIDFIKLPNIIF